MSAPTESIDTPMTGTQVPTDAAVLLVVEDDAAMRQMCRELFARRGYQTEGAAGPEEALERVRGGINGGSARVNLVLSDVRLGRGLTGIELLKQLKTLDARLPVILMTGYSSVPDAVAAMKLGASDYVTKPFERPELIEKVEAALRALKFTESVHETAVKGNGSSTTGEVVLEVTAAPSMIPGFIGQSNAMRQLYDRIDSAGRSSATALITGESGTGKELVARAVHSRSVRKDKPFIPVNCAALPAHLIESELFGHEAGSFTGASKDGLGLFRAADGGTIFLDEIADMPKDTQAKLLRVLQDRRVRPVGSTRETPVDVRVIAATNGDVEKARLNGSIREDLYYRISVLRLRLPPLRERREDIPLLVDHFLAKHAKKTGPVQRIRKVEPQALARLCSHGWPGNVRELEGAIESVYAQAKSETLTLADLPEYLLADPSSQIACEVPVSTSTPATLPAAQSGGASGGPLSLNSMEKEALLKALAAARGNKSKAAQLLGVSRKRLYRMLSDYGLHGDDTPLPQ